MARFLFCSLSSPGFLLAAIGIAKKLRQKGHEIAFVTDMMHREFLASQGIVRIPRGSEDGLSFHVGLWSHPLAVALQVKHIEYALEQFAADVLVGQQMTLGPLMVGERRNLPVGLIGLATYLWPAHPPSKSTLSDSVHEHQEWTLRETMDKYNQARNLLRFPHCAPDQRELPLMGNLLMLRSIPELEGDISHLPHQVHLVGACLPGDEPCLPELETWLQGAAANNEPVIYVHHGRLFDRPHFWSQLVQALAAIKIRIVADVSRMDCSVGALPQNFFAGSYLPQSRILRYAKVVIATPTTTPVLGSLSAGIPSLLIYGAGGEQPTLAQRCKDAGVARTLLSAEASPGRIYAELLALLKDGAVSQAARHMARAFSRAAKTDYATELLERLALTHSMVRGAVTQSSDAS